MSDNHESWQGAASEHAGRERRQGRFFPWVRESGLVRSAEERWIGGVCGGLGRYLGWSPLLVRALMIGVGAAFDYEAGNIRRAPAWMQRCSLEWLYRLLQDPRRLFKRYFVTNTRFLWWALRH